MNKIPQKIKDQLAKDPFMLRCVMKNEWCAGRIEWDHVLKFANKQVQEAFAIVPQCNFHHRGGGLNREYTEYVAFTRLTDDEFFQMCNKYPRSNWPQLRKYLFKKYGKKT